MRRHTFFGLAPFLLWQFYRTRVGGDGPAEGKQLVSLICHLKDHCAKLPDLLLTSAWVRIKPLLCYTLLWVVLLQIVCPRLTNMDWHNREAGWAEERARALVEAIEKRPQLGVFTYEELALEGSGPENEACSRLEPASKEIWSHEQDTEAGFCGQWAVCMRGITGIQGNFVVWSRTPAGPWEGRRRSQALGACKQG